MSGPLFGPGPGVVTPGTPPLDGPVYIAFTCFSCRFADTCTHSVPILIIVLTFNNVDSLEKLPFIRSLFRAFEVLF